MSKRHTARLPPTVHILILIVPAKIDSGRSFPQNTVMDAESQRLNRRDGTSDGEHDDEGPAAPSSAYVSEAMDKEAPELEAEAISERKHDDEAGAKIWSVYISEADKYDKALVESWKNDMDGMLIFAGLFSAILSAFLIESYKSLTPDSEDRTVALLGQISTQLAGIANGTTINIPPPEPFLVPMSSLVCNLLWFTSLGLSLSSALIATLVEQWARDFRYKTDMCSSPVIRARIFAYLYYGLKRYKMHAVVDLIPFLLHASLVLFFAGLVAFLVPVNHGAMILLIVLLGVLMFVYAALTVFPLLYHDSPYKTPLSAGLWRIVQHLRTLYPGAKVSCLSSSMVDAMNETANCSSPHREERDRSALSWTVKSLSNDVELEPFLEGIPDALYSSGPHGRRRAYDKQIEILLRDSKVQLLKRTESFLRDCDSDLTTPETQTRRHITALKALWAIAATLPTAGQLMIESSAQFDWLLVRKSVLPGINCFQVSARAALYLNVVMALLSEVDAHLQVLTKIEQGLLPGDVYSLELSQGMQFSATRLKNFISQSQKWHIDMEESLLRMAPEVEGLVAGVSMNEIGSSSCPSIAASSCRTARSALQSLQHILIHIQDTVHADFLRNAAAQEPQSYQFDATESLFTSQTSSYNKFEGVLFARAFDGIAMDRLVPVLNRPWPMAISEHADEVLGTLLLLIVMWGRGMDGAVIHVPWQLGWYLSQQPYGTQSAVLQKCNYLHLCHCLMAQINRTPSNNVHTIKGIWLVASAMVGQHPHKDQLARPLKLNPELPCYPQLFEQILETLHPFVSSVVEVRSAIPLIQTYVLNTMFPELLDLHKWKFEADTLVLLHPFFANLHPATSMSVLDLRMAILSNFISGFHNNQMPYNAAETLRMLTQFYPESPGVSLSLQLCFAENWNTAIRTTTEEECLAMLGWTILDSHLFFTYRARIASQGDRQFCWLNDTSAVQIIIAGLDLWGEKLNRDLEQLNRYKSIFNAVLDDLIDTNKGHIDGGTAEVVDE